MLGGEVIDRRRYPRVHADILCRPGHGPLFHQKRNTQDISLGGARVFSDDEYGLGTRLDLDVLMPDGSSVRCWAEVVWLTDLGPSGQARFDMGLKFTDMAPADVQRLSTVLVRSG